MKFLKSYTGAMVVLAAVIVLSAPLGCLRSVNAQRAQVLELFAQGGQGWPPTCRTVSARRKIC